MKVLLVDDNRLMLEGLQNLLEAHGVEVAGLALDGLQSVELTRKLKPDVVLMDIRMPDCDGLSATRLIKSEMPDTKIIILTTSTEDQDLFEAVKSGACGYLLKSINSDELIDALDQAQNGTPPFSAGLAEKLLKEFTRVSGISRSDSGDNEQTKPEGKTDTKLNSRQIEVLQLVADGLSYKEVGSRLALSPRTVKYHMAEIMNKLHMENRAQVLAYAGKIGLNLPSNQE